MKEESQVDTLPRDLSTTGTSHALEVDLNENEWNEQTEGELAIKLLPALGEARKKNQFQDLIPLKDSQEWESKYKDNLIF